MTEPDISEFLDAVPVRGPTCSVHLILTRLSPERADSFRAALAQPREVIPSNVISKIVTGWGERVSPETVKRHRSHGCACPVT